MQNKVAKTSANRTGNSFGRRGFLVFLMSAPLATCVGIKRQPAKPTCGRGRSPDDCYQFNPFRVERLNRNFPVDPP